MPDHIVPAKRACRPAPVRRQRRIAAAVGLVVVALLGGCVEEPPPRTDFPPLTYDYLPKIRLNVATIDVDNAWQPTAVPGGTHVEALSPVPPAATLVRMAQTRLVPVGASGHAVLIIDDASLIQRGGMYEGNMQVHLDVTTSDGAHSGYAKAGVTATRTLTADTAPAARAALYDLTRRMMADMNAELEYQIHKTLRDYLEVDGNVAPPPPVQQETLPGSPPALVPAPAVPAPVPVPASPAAPPPTPDAPPDQSMSPPPGNLAAPPAAAPPGAPTPSAPTPPAPTPPAPTPPGPTPLAPTSLAPPLPPLRQPPAASPPVSQP